MIHGKPYGVKDKNHDAVASWWKSKGARVEDTWQVGRGFPDITLQLPNEGVWFCEVKNPERSWTKKEMELEIAFAQKFPFTVVLATGIPDLDSYWKFYMDYGFFPVASYLEEWVKRLK